MRTSRFIRRLGIKNIGVGQGEEESYFKSERVLHVHGVSAGGAGEDAVHASGGDRDDCGIGGQQEIPGVCVSKAADLSDSVQDQSDALLSAGEKEADLLHAAEKRGGCEASAVHAAIPQEARRLDDPGDSSSVGS